MLEENFVEVYSRFKLNLYRGVFTKVKERTGSLSATEAFSLEIIQALDRPTISQFANFIRVSQSNATYKVNTLIGKGYLYKINSDDDKREYHLGLTQKYYEYSNISENYLATVLQRIRQRFDEEEIEQFAGMLAIIASELMEETAWYET